MVDRETQYWRTMEARHGVPKQELRRMLREQGNRCKICPTMNETMVAGKRLQLDHSHKTGEVRGFLCRRCNKRVDRVERGCGEANGRSNRYDRTPYLAYIGGES